MLNLVDLETHKMALKYLKFKYDNQYFQRKKEKESYPKEHQRLNHKRSGELITEKPCFVKKRLAYPQKGK